MSTVSVSKTKDKQPLQANSSNPIPGVKPRYIFLGKDMDINNLKQKYDDAFDKYGNTFVVMKYVLNSTWYGDFPHRDDNANDYPSSNRIVSGYTEGYPAIKGFVNFDTLYKGASRSTWSSSGTSYATSVRTDRTAATAYIPYNTVNQTLVKMNFRQSSTSNRSFNRGRDVVLFRAHTNLENYEWKLIWAAQVEIVTLGDIPLFIKMSGPALDAVCFPFEFCYDESGNVKQVEKIIPGITTAPIIIYP
jgi:hypothetical protein